MHQNGQQEALQDLPAHHAEQISTACVPRFGGVSMFLGVVQFLARRAICEGLQVLLFVGAVRMGLGRLAPRRRIPWQKYPPLQQTQVVKFAAPNKNARWGGYSLDCEMGRGYASMRF